MTYHTEEPVVTNHKFSFLKHYKVRIIKEKLNLYYLWLLIYNYQIAIAMIKKINKSSFWALTIFNLHLQLKILTRKGKQIFWVNFV